MQKATKIKQMKKISNTEQNKKYIYIYIYKLLAVNKKCHKKIYTCKIKIVLIKYD
jgi:hypothetical protein